MTISVTIDVDTLRPGLAKRPPLVLRKRPQMPQTVADLADGHPIRSFLIQTHVSVQKGGRFEVFIPDTPWDLHVYLHSPLKPSQ